MSTYIYKLISTPSHLKQKPEHPPTTPPRPITMISWHDLYTVLSAMVPLYVAMILAYGSVRWWGIFTPDQCSGINRFVALFAVPLLSFHFISTNNPYDMNLPFIAADTLQKLTVLAALSLWASFTPRGSLEWMITTFSLSTLPNTLVMGIPLFIAMYGPYAGRLLVQVVVLQCILWYTLLLFLFEYRGAKILITEQFPDTAASIVSVKVDPDVVSLDGREFLQTEAEVGQDGKLRVTVRKSNASASRPSLGGGPGSLPSFGPRLSNLTGAEIYSLSSSRNPTPRGSSFNHADFYSLMTFAGRPSNFGGVGAELYSVQSSRSVTPRPSNFEDSYNNAVPCSSPSFGFYHATTTAQAAYPSPNPEFAAKSKRNQPHHRQHQPHPPPQDNHQQVAPPPSPSPPPTATRRKTINEEKDLQMFVWSASASPVSEVGGLNVFSGGDQLGSTTDQSDGVKEMRMLVPDQQQHHHPQNGEAKGEMMDAFIGEGEDFTFADGSRGMKTKTMMNTGVIGEEEEDHDLLHREGDQKEDVAKAAGGTPHHGGGGRSQMPPVGVMTRLILIMVWRKLIRNPNTYSSLIGVVWSLIAFRWDVEMPKIAAKSISILSDAGLGMAMFSLGLFMALQPKIIACGNRLATFSIAVRFLMGPAVMAVCSVILGLRGDLLRIAIVQAALPQGIVPFVFAREYSNHPAVLSTAVIFGMLIALPIDLVYYILLGI